MENTTAKVSLFARGYHYENSSVHVFADTAAKKLLGQDCHGNVHIHKKRYDIGGS